MALDNPYQFSLQTVAIKDIRANAKNPRGIKKSRAKALKKQIEKFGYLDRVVLNKDLTIIAGHQRIEIFRAKSETHVECMVAGIQLSEEEADELLIGHNLNVGFWDEVLIEANYSEDFLAKMEFGKDLHKVERNFGANDDPVYPIVPRFSEKHNYVMIVTDNEIDEANLRSMLKLGKMKDYKTSKVSEGYVITFEDFKKAVE